MANAKEETLDFIWHAPTFKTKLVNRNTILSAVSIASLFLSWALLVHFQVYRFSLLPSPAEVLEEGIAWVKTNVFWIDAFATTLRVLVGVLAAYIIAIPLGLMIGWKKVFSDLTFPTLEVLRPIPAPAYLPLAILLLPTREASVAFIPFIDAFFPVLLNTITGVKIIDRDYFRAARCLGSSPKQIFWHVVLPGALPSISSGCAIGMGIGWMGAVVGEMITGKWGLGYRIWESYILIRYPLIVDGMIAIGILGLASSVLIRYLTVRLIPWRRAITESLDESITK
ncbi:MAG: ABC transporter permease [Deltaproteobacteria bacterium]|nr:MAG: ABC transporter permease [Deltaproteobacteria bacterium]